MRRLGGTALAAALACAVFPAAAEPHPGHGPPSIYVSGLKFQPDQLTIYVGDAIIWVWNGPDTNHSVTADPGQAMSFDSDAGKSSDQVSHAVGDAYSVTFTQPGTFTYACKVHSFMKGSVTVKPVPPDQAGSGTGTAPAVSAFKAKAVKGRRQAQLSFTLSAAADINATIKRVSGGKVLREVDFSAKAGTVKKRFSLARLKPGRYKIKVVAVDASSGLASTAVAATVQVRR